MTSESIYNDLMQKGVLVSPELMEKNYDEDLIKNIYAFFGNDLDVLDEEIVKNYLKKQELEEKNKVKIVKDYIKEPSKWEYKDFVSTFNNRFKKISGMLKNRHELAGVISLSRLKDTPNNQKVVIMGMVLNKDFTKNNNLILELEDPTGKSTVIMRKEGDKDLYEKAKDIVLDEVIGVSGVWLGSAVFANEFYYPDVPLSKELKKQKEEEYVVFMGDTHFGSKVFMEEEFKKFIKWINCELGNDKQKEVASKVKYIVMTGDIIEGAGTYPGQENDLKYYNVERQYEEAAYWLKKIPSHIQIISTTGNHDVGRLSEPQEKPYYEAAKSLYNIPNLKLVSNPGVVNIGAKNGFPGFNITLYHGGSLIYYSENIPSVRASGGQKRVDLILKFYLQRRHLAPTHGSTLIIPDSEEDYLVLDEVPDFLATGHIHRASMSNYRNVTLLNTSCWTETTEDQIKRGLEPQPARILIANLKTREVKSMNFLTKDRKEEEKKKVERVKE